MRLTDEQIAALRPDYLRSLASEVLESRAAIRKSALDLMVAHQEGAELSARVAELEALLDVDRLTDIITDSIDLDWTPRDAAKAIVRAMGGAGDE